MGFDLAEEGGVLEAGWIDAIGCAWLVRKGPSEIEFLVPDGKELGRV